MLIVLVFLCITVLLLFFFIYKHLALQKKYHSLLQENKADAKVLFLQSKYASMGETVGNIAHQWKQPLNAIGSIQNSIKASLVFQGEISKEKLLYSVDTSFKLLQHLAETIDTFYSFLSQQNNARMSFEVAEELEKVRKITEYSFHNSNISLTFELEVNPTIQGNANEFTHAMLNIILNAKDAFDGVSVVSPQIKVHVGEGNQRCIISISDNAGGIRLDPVEMVFDLHITTKESGSGLGLFMTKNIIENRFGGKISVANVNQGACFTMELPYSQYGERFADAVTLDEKITLERINKLAHKIIELEEVEKALKMWADIFKHARWGIAIYVESGQCFEMSNNAFASLYGYTNQEIQKLTLADFFTPESLPFFLEIQAQALQQGYAVLEAEHRRKNGNVFPVSIELIVVKDDNDKVLYIIANIWDLTEQKQTEENLLLKEFALNKISEAVFLIDENAKFHYVNESACKNLQYNEEELRNMRVFDINSSVSPQLWSKLWNETQIEKITSLETSHKRKDGTVVPVEINSNYFEYQNINYNLATVRDISERLEVAKRKEDEKMRLFFERQIVGMAITSPKEGWIQTNDKLCEILGYSHEELSLISWVEMTHPEDRERDLELFNKIFSGEIDDYTLEKRAIRKDNEIIYINLAVSCVRHEDGSVDYILALIEDITERKKAVEALHKSEKLYRDSSNLLHSVMESSTEVTIFALDKEYKYLTFNELHKKFYKKKYGIDVAKGKSFIELIPDKEFAQWAKHSFDRALVGESFSVVSEEGLLNNGIATVEHWNSFVSPIFDDTKKITGLTVFSINITKRREMEIKLESLNNTLEQKVKERTFELQQAVDFNEGIINAIPDLMFEMNLTGTYLNVWAKNEELLAAQKEILLGNRLSDVLPKEAATVAMEAIQEANEKGLSLGKTLKIDLADGAHWFELSSSKKADGNVIVISRDVTEQKVAQMKIEEEKEKFSKLFMSSPAAVSVTSLERNIYLEVNESFLYFTKYTRDEVVGKSSADLQLFANVNERTEFFRRVLDEGIVRDFEFQYRAKDGTTGYGLAFATIIYIKGEKCVLSHSYDINARKQLELVNTAVNSTSEAIYIIDETLSIIYVNNGACNMLGYTKEELTSMKVSDIDVTFPKEEFFNIREQVLHRDQVSFTTKHRKKNQEIIDVEIQGSSFLFHNKPVELAVVQDITAKKRFEEQLKLLETAINNANDAIYIVDNDRYIRYVSHAASRMLGYSVEEFLTMKVEDIDPNMTVPEIEGVREKVSVADTTSFQTKHRTKEGKILDVAITVTKFVFNDTQLRLSIVKDITQQLLYEAEIKELNRTLEAKVVERTKELQKALEFNSSIIQAIPDMLFEISKEGVYLNIWTRDEKLLAAQRELLLGKKFQDMLPPEAAEISSQTMKEVDMYGSSLGNTYKLDLPDGEHWFELHTTRKEPEGTYLALVREITERKVAQKALLELNETLEEKVQERTLELQKSLEFTQEIMNTLPDILFEIDANGIYLNVWARDEQFLATQKELLLGRSIYDVLSPEAADIAMQVLQEASVKGSSFGKVIAIDFPNETRYFEESACKKSSTNTFLVLSHDITEQKRFEISLQEREEMFRAIVENSPDVISCYNLSMQRTYVNPMMQTLLNKPLEEILGKTPREFSPLPDIEQFEEMFFKVIHNQQELEHEGEYKAPWGESRWGNQRIVPMFDADKLVNGVMVIGRDITERIETQKQLMMIEAAINNSSEAVYINDPSLTIIYVNQAACDMLGYTRNELLQMKITDIDTLLSPEEIEKLLEQKITLGKAIFQTKHRAKDGTLIDVAIVGNHFRYNTMLGYVSVVKEQNFISKPIL